MRTSRPQGFARPFFLAVFFRVTYNELSERGTTRGLICHRLPNTTTLNDNQLSGHAIRM